ncbi:Protein ROS1 [Bienertia sinuspersici]
MMETHKGKSVPIVKNFQIEGNWVPTTPIKPTLPHLGQIYENGEVEAYLSRYSHQNQAQTLLSYSITSAETSNMNIPSRSNNNIDNYWDGRINLQRESVEMQRRGLEDYLPNWSNQGRRTKINYSSINPGEGQSSNFPYLSSWESSLQWRNNGVRDNGSAVLSHEQLDQLHNAPMSFGDLLAMNGSAAYLPGWDCNTTASTSVTLNGSSMFCNQNSFQQHNMQQHNLHQIDQQIGHKFRDTQNCASHPYHNICDANSPLTTKHANKKNSTFAPSTPDSRWRIDSNMALGNTPFGQCQGPLDEQNGLPEQDVAAAMVDLQNVHEEVVVHNTADSSPGKASMAVESHSPGNDKGGDQVIDLNKTPQKKPRRRRYQPKVLSEKKPKRTPKPKPPKPDTDSKETAPVKRKYVRKGKVNTPSTPPLEVVAEAREPTPAAATEAAEPTPTAETEAGATKPTGTAKSCRKSLNFDLNGVAADTIHMPNGDSHAELQPNTCDTTEHYSHTVHLMQGKDLVVETSRGATAYDLNRNSYQELQSYLSLPTKECPNISQSRNVHPGQSLNSSPCASSSEQEQTRGTKRNNSCIADGSVDVSKCTFWKPSDTISSNATIGELHKIFFPEICKKKRTEKVIRTHGTSMSSTTTPSEYVNQVAGTLNNPKVDPTASRYYCNPAPLGGNVVTSDHARVLIGSVENKAHFINTWADLARPKKKRSKGTTRVRNLDPLKGIASPLPAKPGPKGPRKKKIFSDSLQPPTSNSIQSCPETLPADSKTNPRSIKRSRKQKSSDQWDIVLYNQSTRKATGSIPALPWVKTSSSSVEEITEGLRLLDINRKVCNTSRQKKNALVLYRGKKKEQNALVVYGRDGTMVPFEGPFDPIRKRRQRAKVDLDDETTRVWRLLLENIDNKGIDGSDEDKAKWWENERSVFRGRVDSFIARMRLVQGDRRFTPWKGSVLDSVIGVFLTQNVSDHLSSSAFMSLAAQFPLKSESSESTLSEESTTALVEEPDVIEPEESIAWYEKTVDQQTLSSNRRITDVDHIEAKEVINSTEPRAPGSVSPKDSSSESSQKVSHATSQITETETASILGDDRAKDDATSSQHSVISSQHSINSPNLQTAGIMSNFAESSSRKQPATISTQGNYFDCSTSFLGLLKLAESPFLHHESYSHTQQDQLESMNHVTYGSPAAQRTCSYDTLLNLNFQLSDAKGIEMLELESKSPDRSRKDENSSPTEQSNLTTESTMQHLALERSSDSIPRSYAENTCSFYVLEGEKMVMQSHRESVEPSDTVASSVIKQTSSTSKSTDLSQVNADFTESTTELKGTSNDQKEVEQTSAHASGEISDLMNANTSKPKKGKTGKGKNDAFDWDSLRREAQADGKIRERTANTRDSLDWEAVRHAHVSEIAETIKERGMNNMLAERIKDLLDRLVKDHGSTDMEWLRDIPPDKAKEYLLSFRGLGLKSVECVRLLTLHHLAFPVDTNVGRIAVRLGWVPLQPLPESLQLHLLELYPILESIQKFLWPRLCKLDQKTLYELHYHLITFGKVC